MEFTCIKRETINLHVEQMRQTFRNIFLDPRLINTHVTYYTKKLLGTKTKCCMICAIIHVIKSHYEKQDVVIEDDEGECAISVKQPCFDGLEEGSLSGHPHHMQASVWKQIDTQDNNGGMNDLVQEASITDNAMVEGDEIVQVNKEADVTINQLKDDNVGIDILEENNREKSNTANNRDIAETCIVDDAMELRDNNDNISIEHVAVVVDDDECDDNDSIVEDMNEQMRGYPIVLTLPEHLKLPCMRSHATSDSFRSTLTNMLQFWFGNFVADTLYFMLRLIRSRDEFAGVYEWVLSRRVSDSMTIVVIPICRIDDFKLLLHQSYGFIYIKKDCTLSVYLHKSFDNNISNLLSVPSNTWFRETFCNIKLLAGTYSPTNTRRRKRKRNVKKDRNRNKRKRQKSDAANTPLDI